MKAMKKLACYTLAVLVFSALYAAASSADSFPDALGIRAKSENIIFYSAPDETKAAALNDFLWEYDLYADTVVVENSKDGSRWYKIIYYWPYGDSLLRQTNKMTEFNRSFAYVRADDVVTRPAEEHVKIHINRLREGRPPQFKVGDTFEYDEWRNPDRSVIIELTAPAALLAAPDEGAPKAGEAPKGFKCLGPVYATEDSFPNIHANMEEVNWALVVDVGTAKILGWIKSDELGEISKWIEPDIK
ncbi:MAG: hypothetical protein FWF87_04865 [Synergistaceae bacterium]|nr:hypothetical protein [Synergistaceae bacterium]